MKKTYKIDVAGDIHREANNHESPVWDLKPEMKIYKHFTYRHARELIDRKTWRTYEKIGFIRHPYDWVPSLYNQPRIDKAMDETNILDGDPDKPKPFAEFVRDLKHTPMTWLTDEDGTVLCDTIWRTEDMEEFFKKYRTKYVRTYVSRTPKPELTDDLKAIIDDKFVSEMAFYV